MTIDFSLAGKAVLVTGANSGIGRQIAITLAHHGADIAIHYLGNGILPEGAAHSAPGKEAAALVAAEIRWLGRKAVLVEGDLSLPATPEAVLTAAEDVLGPLHAVVNNAAHCGFPDNLLEARWESYHSHFDVNLAAPTMLMSGFARRCMERSQTVGRIVNISTDSARAFPGQVFYGTSKAALEAMTRAAAIELGPLGITVNAVAPGPVQTGYIDAELAGKVMPSIPMRRLGLPEDVVGAVGFLLSDAAGWITGQVIQVSGGHAL